MSEATRILQAVEHGDPRAAEELLPLVYEELRKLAASKMSLQPPNQTLQPTALVHEAYLMLLGDGNHSWQDRRHFFAFLDAEYDGRIGPAIPPHADGTERNPLPIDAPLERAHTRLDVGYRRPGRS